VRQVALLESFCAANGWAYEVITDVGSALNYHKRGLRTLPDLLHLDAVRERMSHGGSCEHRRCRC
jgi:predicted site-specific integrase-resolvase